MSYKIAVITTEFMVDYIHSTFSRMQLDCEYQIYLYEKFQDIPELYQQIPEDVEGVLASGTFPVRIIELLFPNTQKVVMPFNTDDAAICQLFFRLLEENRCLDFGRVYADLFDMFDIDLKTYLMHDFSIPLSVTTKQAVCEKDLEEIYEIEELQYQQHLQLWNSGMVDLCVTRFSSIVKRLREQGVPVYFTFPSIGYLREICLALFKEIEYQRLQEGCPASISVAVANTSQIGISAEYQLLTLQTTMMEFFGADSRSYFMGRNTSGIEILTDRKNIEKLTDGYRNCKIQDYLRYHVSFPVCVGYGIGKELHDARVNARKALVLSQKSEKRESFLINEKNVVLEPLGVLQQHTVIEKVIDRTDKQENKKASVPEYKKKEVLKIMQDTLEQQITAQELADKLFITKRSANRLLSALKEEEVVEVVKTRATSTKGRPERVYGPVRLQL